jgi:hypothetical protein
MYNCFATGSHRFFLKINSAGFSHKDATHLRNYGANKVDNHFFAYEYYTKRLDEKSICKNYSTAIVFVSEIGTYLGQSFRR